MINKVITSLIQANYKVTPISNCSVNSLYLLRMVTSVTPAISATSLWVFLSPSKTDAIYNAAAATPVGPLPEVNPFYIAFSIISMALDCASPDKPNSDANLGT